MSTRRIVEFIALGLFTASLAMASQFHVTISGGSSGDGSTLHPWSLEYALGHPASVKAGDTIWVHGGTYRSTGTTTSSLYYVKLKGSSGRPIIVRNYNNERAIINGNNIPLNQFYISAECSNVWFWGLEMCNTDIKHRVSATNLSEPTDIDISDGIQAVGGSNCKYINMIFHDITGSGFFMPAQNIEIYGCLAYDIGWTKSDRTSGYPFYIQNRYGIKRLKHNIVVNNYSYGIHGYGSDAAWLDSITVDANIVRDNPIFIGGGQDLSYGDSIVNNTFWSNWVPFSSGGIQLGFGARGPSKAVVKNNWLHSAWYTMTMLNAVSCEVTGNHFFSLTGQQRNADGADFDGAYPNNSYAETSNETRGFTTGDTSFVFPNQYERGRAHVSVWNFSGADSATVPVAGAYAEGDVVDLYNAQDFFGDPPARVTVRNGRVRIPMKSSRWSQSIPSGETQALTPESFPYWGAFVVKLVTAAPHAAAVSPGQGQSDVPTDVTITWTRSAGATAYHLQLSKDSLFRSFVVNDSTLVDTLRRVTGLTTATKYFYRVRAKYGAAADDFGIATWFITQVPKTDVPEAADVPGTVALMQNFPNPFNPSTTIAFDVALKGRVTLKIYSALGTEVGTITNEVLEPGHYQRTWNAGNIASGVYLYRLTVGNDVRARRMLLLK